MWNEKKTCKAALPCAPSAGPSPSPQALPGRDEASHLCLLTHSFSSSILCISTERARVLVWTEWPEDDQSPYPPGRPYTAQVSISFSRLHLKSQDRSV